MGLIVRDINFGSVFISSGGNNFNGEGWRYDKIYKYIPGYSLLGTTHYTKTFTVESRNDSRAGKGNMDIDEDTLQPRELLPKCIKINFFKPWVINSVGLSGLGLETHLKRGELQALTKNLLLSVMSIGKTLKERLEESEEITSLLERHLPLFNAKIGLVRNISCPNAGHQTKDLIDEAKMHLKISSRLNVPQGIKINLHARVPMVKKIIDGGDCDFIDIPNSYPLIDMPDEVRCHRQSKYILKKYKNTGGYSGTFQTPMVRYWIIQAREQGIHIPIIAGSVYSEKHVEWMHNAGADAIAIGAVKIVRPHRLKNIIKLGHKLF